MDVAARNPRTPLPAGSGAPLAPRLGGLDATRVCLIHCMPPYDAGAVMDAVAAEISARSSSCQVEYFNRRDFMIDDPHERDAVVDRSDAAVLFVGPSATSLAVHWYYGAELERAGLPVSLVVPAPLTAGVEREASVRSIPLRWTLAPERHDDSERLRAMSASSLAHLVDPLTPEESAARTITRSSNDYLASGSADEVHAELLDQGMTDGLPVTLPTDERVEAMLAGTSRDADEIVCEMLRPEGVATSVEAVAINAVLAGARPEHLPVILAAASLYGDIQLESMTRSVNGFGFTHLINGPLARELGVEAGTNATGHGNPVNNVIGRAIALVVQNCGHQRFGVTSSPAMGNPLGVGVFAENERESPWEPLHTGLGFRPDDNAVSLFAGGHRMVGNFNFSDLDAVVGELQRFDMSTGALLLVSAKRAAELADRGLGRTDVVDHLWTHATTTLGALRASMSYNMVKVMIERGGDDPLWPRDHLDGRDDRVVQIYPRRGLMVAVVGSTLASMMQLWSSTRIGTASVDEWR